MRSDTPRDFAASCPRGIGELLAREIEELGGSISQTQDALVLFRGSRATFYRVSLWSRLANRVLLPIASGPSRDASELYATARSVDWAAVLASGTRFTINFSGTNSAIRDTRFGALRCKDALVDYARESTEWDARPEPKAPQLRISARLHRDKVELALDLSGESLHRRGYRTGSGEAPLKENLAAACLRKAGWNGAIDETAALIDPMCGSATLLIEGALLALDQAPALGRHEFAFKHWIDHDEQQWTAIRAEAESRARAGRERPMPEIRGYDADPKVIAKAQQNIAEAGLSQWVRVGVKPLADVVQPTHRLIRSGYVVSNPPYGIRLSEPDVAKQLYTALGELLAREFVGWKAAVLSPTKEQGKALGLRSHKQLALYNGGKQVFLLLLDLENNHFRPPSAASVHQTEDSGHDSDSPAEAKALSDGAQMLVNRLRKNQRRLAKWLKKEAVSCYRIYDADMPEYAVAIDRYGDWLHVAEYQAPSSVDDDAVERRRQEVKQALPVALEVPKDRTVFKERRRQRGSQQYERREQRSQKLTVREGNAKLLVNLHDYLDTGLFLDHRPLRLRFASECRGKRFLNLFCYTGAATVHAALGGAHRSDSVDLSKTYLRWFEENLAVNGLGDQFHRAHREDVMQWLAQCRDSYDLIFVDPPSFSNSRKLASDFDVQRDHANLLRSALKRLATGGVLYFSNNLRRFSLDQQLSSEFLVEDVTRSTIDVDFQRTGRPPHRCWMLRTRE
ncbi:MAG: bifunctional 23S rRNA (guanine(2069)-N(7))-methyltransferase RlmK/23S rRNA (guanine(2445)-N(2))-methyltransferase RlmL [Pseudomonadota bacterium]